MTIISVTLKIFKQRSVECAVTYSCAWQCHPCFTRSGDLSDNLWTQHEQMRTNSARHPAEEEKKNTLLKTETWSEAEGRNSPGAGASEYNKASRKSDWESNYQRPATEWTDSALSARVSQTKSADGECPFSSVCTVCVCSLPSLRRSPLRFSFLWDEVRWWCPSTG